MVVLAQFLGGLLASIASLFGLSLAKRVIFATAAVVASVALATALYVAISALLGPIAASLTNQWVLMGIALVLPSNFPVCVSAIVSAYFFRWLYDLNLTNLKIISSIN